MNRLFFKTVREDYSSVYAPGILRHFYRVGTKHKFPKDLPAHVFVPINSSMFPLYTMDQETLDNTQLDAISSDEIYKNRPESTGGNRVMICFGELEIRELPCFSIDAQYWTFPANWDEVRYNSERRYCSCDFEVIGEIALPRYRYASMRRPGRETPIRARLRFQNKALAKELGLNEE